MQNHEIISLLLSTKKVDFQLAKLLKCPLNILKDVVNYSGYELVEKTESKNDAPIQSIDLNKT